MSVFEAVGFDFKIGDPSFMGWSTVAAYFITGVISFKLYLSSEQFFSEMVHHKQRRFWLV